MKDSLGNTIPKNALIIRHTEVSDFRHCRLSWFVHSHNGLNLTPVLKSPKLKAGSIWHKGMEFHYAGATLEEGVHEGYNHEIESLEKVFGDALYDVNIRAELDESRDLALLVGEAYEEWARTEAYPSDDNLRIVGVEQRYVVPVTAPNGRPTRIWLAAKLDGIVRYANMIWVMEHKFLAKSTRVDNPDHLPIDLQMGLQLIVLAKVFPGEPIGGAIYNIARKQAPGPRVRSPLFGRHIVERPAHERRRLECQLYHDAARMRLCKRSADAIYPNPQPFGGKCTWGCSARDVCEALQKEEDYLSLLNTQFVKRDRDIWQMLEDETEGGE